MAEERWDVFVSYGHGDAEWVRVLAANLHRTGLSVFLDEWEMGGGDSIVGRMEEGIRGSASGVLVVSPHSLSRPWVREEYEALLRQAVEIPGRRLIPVLYADAELPLFLANRAWVDFRGTATTGPAYDASFERLVRALRGHPAADRPDRDSPREWPTGAGGERFRAAGAMRAKLRITAAEVSLAVSGAEDMEVTQAPRGLQQFTIEAVRELAWRRAYPRPGADPSEQDAALADVGRRLGADFLTGEVGVALAGLVTQAASLGEVLELGVEVTGAELADLPWETLQVPDVVDATADLGERPLVLQRSVALYRLAGGLGPSPAHNIKGPLRLLVAIASPETGGAELLDYEDELARIVAAVEPARKGQAYVQVLNEGSLAAINAALSEDPDGFHVLHLSCHARPGELILETADGEADPVTADRLLDEGVPAGAHLPMVVLSGCSTGLSTRLRRLNTSGSMTTHLEQLKDEERAGEATLASFAARLIAAGVPQVLAMQGPVTDAYATRLCAEFYRRLAAVSPDPLLALSEARRAAERARLALPADSPRRGPAEWATPTLLAPGLRLLLYNPHERGEVRPPQAPVLAEGVAVREVGDFVGRRREMREARRSLSGHKAGLIVHGIGGVGKSSLAAQVLRSFGGDAELVVSQTGQLSVDAILGEAGTRIHQAASLSVGEVLGQAALKLRAADVEWADRWRFLAEQILPSLRMTVLLDNFEDNLCETDSGDWQVRDPELANLLTGWARRPGRSRLIFTSRHPFSLPEQAERRLATLHLGPLSAAETRKLIWRLPGLDVLSPDEQNRAYRDIGGHPRTLEYLDALLRGGEARFDDVAQRMEDRLREKGIADPAAWLSAPGRDLDTNLAEAITLAVDDVVLSRLLDQLSATPLAAALVIGGSVYRVPVDDTALAFQVGEHAERPSDPDRTARLQRVGIAIAAAAKRLSSNQITLDDAGLTAGEFARYEADLAEERRPPYDPPTDLAAAVRAARAAGLLIPVDKEGGASLHFVHRWTARAIAQLHPEAITEYHRRAAAFWRWRFDWIEQNRKQAVEQLLEGRYHHRAAEETDEAVAITQHAVVELRTWGQYGRAAELCREILTWLPADSRMAAMTEHELGMFAYLRGDYAAAERSYRRSLEISEQLGEQEQAHIAGSYHQLGMLAQAQGDYDTAETLYRHALQIDEGLGDQTGLITGYGQLGTLAHQREDYDTAETLYRRSLEISEQLGEQAHTATSYYQLGVLAQEQGDYDTAETLYRRSLQISEHLSDPAGIARAYSQLGMLAQEHGDYGTAETLYRHAVQIEEQLGNQADMAIMYHQLGAIAAQYRGDYDTAETLFGLALDIDQRLGNRAGIAIDYHNLATLSKQAGNLDNAVTYRVAALIVQFNIGVPPTADIRALSEWRNELGIERFRAALPAWMEENSANDLMRALDTLDQEADS
jgi:tetratricopeptide (TPR) repeat protein